MALHRVTRRRLAGLVAAGAAIVAFAVGAFVLLIDSSGETDELLWIDEIPARYDDFLEGLKTTVLPPEVQLRVAKAQALLDLAEEQGILRQYEAHEIGGNILAANEGFVMGRVADVRADRLTVAALGTGESFEKQLTADTMMQRGPETIGGDDLRVGELVLMMSRQGQSGIAYLVRGTGVRSP